MQLHHLTLNTGHLAIIHDSTVQQDVIDQLLPLVDGGRSEIPGLPGWFIDILSPLDLRGMPKAGAAFFQISDEPAMSQRPVLMAIVCWREEMQEDAWQRLGQSYQALRGPLQQVGLWQPLPPVSPLLPWICVWLTPYITLADVGQAMAFGDLGQNLAWAFIAARP